MKKLISLLAILSAFAIPVAALPQTIGSGYLGSTATPMLSELAVTDLPGTITSSAQELTVLKTTTLSVESLAETNFATHAKWDVTGDFTDSTGAAVYTHSAGSGTLTQTSSNMVSAGGLSGSRWYKFVYTVSSVTAGCTATITTAVAASAQTLTLTAGEQTLYFKSTSLPGNFVISVTSTAGGFTLDDLSLKQVIGGDMYVGGTIYAKNFASSLGGSNFGAGRRTLDGITSGYDNHASGIDSGRSITTGYQNTLLGKSSGEYITTGYDNTLIGLESGRLVDTGYRNTFVGEESGSSVTSGSVNTFIGFLAGDGVTTGSYGIALGRNTTMPTNTNDSYVNIGNWLYGDIAQGWLAVGKDQVAVVGSLTACTSNGTTTIAKSSTWGFTPAAGMMLQVKNGTTAADRGVYRIVSFVQGTSFVVDRALSGSDSDLVVVVWKDITGVFYADANGPRIAAYGGTQDKPLNLGGSSTTATTGLTSKDIAFASLVGYAPSDGAATPVAPTDALKFFGYNKSVVDNGVITLPAVTTNGRGFVTVGTAATTYTEFVVGSTGTVTLINNTADVVANADTDAKLDIGTAATQEPLQIKNALGATHVINVMFWYD